MRPLMLVLVILSLSVNSYAVFTCKITDPSQHYAYGTVIQAQGFLRKNKMLAGTGGNLPPEVRAVSLVLESSQKDIFVYNKENESQISCLAHRFTLMLTDSELQKGMECFEKNLVVTARGVVLPAETPIEEIENHILMTATISCPQDKED